MIKVKKLWVAVFIAIVSILLSTYVSAASYEMGWFCRRYGNKQPPLSKEEIIISKYNGYSIDRKVNDSSEKKVIYLTFDAGYENGNMAKIMDTLKEEKVPAAFFILDNILLKNPDLVTRMANEGHLVCNHTKNHKNICSMTDEQIKNDLCALEELCRDKAGVEMAKYFRFPEGKYSEQALLSVSKLGYKTVFWSFAYDDWDNNRQPSPSKAISKVLKNTHNGAVILLHPTSATNAQILPTLIKEWRNMGYTFGTLDELVASN